MALHSDAVGCPADGDCDISSSYSLTFLVHEYIIVVNYNYEKVKMVNFQLICDNDELNLAFTAYNINHYHITVMV